MKQVILIMALVATASISAKAQTNRTYYSNMQTQQMYENERRGGIPNDNQVKLSTGRETSTERQNNSVNANMQMNAIEQHQGYRMNSMQRYYGGSTVTGPAEVVNKTAEYDTSKNNGHCLGCGSGATTDHQKELMNR